MCNIKQGAISSANMCYNKTELVKIVSTRQTVEFEIKWTKWAWSYESTSFTYSPFDSHIENVLEIIELWKQGNTQKLVCQKK